LPAAGQQPPANLRRDDGCVVAAILDLQARLDFELGLRGQRQAVGHGAKQVPHLLPLVLGELLLIAEVVVEGADRRQDQLELVPLHEGVLQLPRRTSRNGGNSASY